MPKKISESQNRYFLVDAVRGLAVLNMLAYHFLYDLFEVYGLKENWIGTLPAIIWQRAICVTFIIVSGISVNFSRHAYRRGIIVNLCGILVTVATVLAMPEQGVWFGILSFIGCSMLITQAMKSTFDRMNPLAGGIVSAALFALTLGVPQRYIGFFRLKLFTLPDALYRFKALSFLGFRSSDFYSSDYFPLIPWIFLFFLGYFLWRLIKKNGKDGVFRLKIPVLGWAGKYSLWIYMAHQVVFMAICYLIFGYI